jgi:hypothetical protein
LLSWRLDQNICIVRGDARAGRERVHAFGAYLRAAIYVERRGDKLRLNARYALCVAAFTQKRNKSVGARARAAGQETPPPLNAFITISIWSRRSSLIRQTPCIVLQTAPRDDYRHYPTAAAAHLRAANTYTHSSLYSERSLMFDMMHGDAAADAALLNKCNKKG